MARVLGVSKATMSRYLRRDDWPVSPAPPWTDEDVLAVRDWRQTLQDDRAADARGQRDRRVPLAPVYDADEPELVRRMRDPAGRVTALSEHAVCFPVERDILRGDRELTPLQVRAYVLAIVSTRLLTFGDALYCRAFVGLTGSQAVRALNDRAHADRGVLRELLLALFGADAAGSRSAWEQGGDPEGEDLETLDPARCLAAYDMQRAAIAGVREPHKRSWGRRPTNQRGKA
jgi:hypothetical protein